MSEQSNPPKDERSALFKGKTPRKALIGIGLMVAAVIGVLAFYTQSQQTALADAEARAAKAEKDVQLSKGSKGVDLDKLIRDQEEAARDAAARAEADKTRRNDLTPAAPGMTADAAAAQLASETAIDQVFTSPVFKQGITKPKDVGNASANAAGMAGMVTPAQMLQQQDAAAQMTMANANAQAAALLERQSAPPQSLSSPDRDLNFLARTQVQADKGGGFARSGFVGRAGRCTLTPPHHIPVLTMEGLNSDRPGTAALVVDEDVYDSVKGDCLMIPKGSTIVAPYSSDIQVGQESILVAATELRLPNGKQVPLHGAQGADQDGMAGFSGDVNTHFLKIFGTSFVTAILLRRFSNNDSSTTQGPLGTTQVGSTGGQVAAQTAQSVLNRYQSIPTTITVKPGARFMIKVNNDIQLEPYRD